MDVKPKSEKAKSEKYNINITQDQLPRKPRYIQPHITSQNKAKQPHSNKDQYSIFKQKNTTNSPKTLKSKCLWYNSLKNPKTPKTPPDNSTMYLTKEVLAIRPLNS